MKRKLAIVFAVLFVSLMLHGDRGYGVLTWVQFYPGPFVQQGDFDNLRLVVDAEVDVMGLCSNFNSPGITAYSQGGCPYGIWADAWSDTRVGQDFVRAGTSVGWFDSDGTYHESSKQGSQDCDLQVTGDALVDFYCQ